MKDASKQVDGHRCFPGRFHTIKPKRDKRLFIPHLCLFPLIIIIIIINRKAAVSHTGQTNPLPQ